MSELVPSDSGLPEEAKVGGSGDLTPDAAAPAETAASTDAAPSDVHVVAQRAEKLASERVIINAPMSFAGAAQRAFRLRGNTTGVARVAATVGVMLLTLVWWAAVLFWYLLFGLFLVPYRLLRRGARKRKAEALRHRELLSAVEKHDR